MVDFGAEIEITYVMGGLAREYGGDLSWLVIEWLDAADRSAMPVDPRLWHEGPLRSTFPACIAVKAAAEQGLEAGGRYLRALREGIMCRRRRLDSAEPLVEEARGAGLDVQRFRVDLESHATLEAFGGDLEETRTIPRGHPRLEDGATCIPDDPLHRRRRRGVARRRPSVRRVADGGGRGRRTPRRRAAPGRP